MNGFDTIAVSPSQVVDTLITAQVPATVSGQTYVFTTSDKPADGAGISDEIVLFGPAIIEVTLPSPTFDTLYLSVRTEVD